MLKPEQRAIVDFLVREKSISTRQVRSLLGCDIKEAYDRLKRSGACIMSNVMPEMLRIACYRGFYCLRYSCLHCMGGSGLRYGYFLLRYLHS